LNRNYKFLLYHGGPKVQTLKQTGLSPKHFERILAIDVLARGIPST
jgi:hypothetical protein